MIDISGNRILSEEQRAFLLSLGKSALRDRFYLTGGTALAAFYVRHRMSDDLDLFSEEPATAEEIIAFLKTLPGISGIEYQHAFDRKRFLLRDLAGETLKVEFTRYPFRRIAPAKVLEGLQVDSVRDILANKLMAMTDRRDAKDFVDFFFGRKAAPELSVEELVCDVEQKFGVTGIRHILQGRFLQPPPPGELKMLVPSDPDEMARYFQDQAREWVTRSLSE